MRRLGPLLLALGAAACNRTTEPTFTLPNITATPPPDADLLVVSDGLGPEPETEAFRDVYALRSSDGAGVTLLSACRFLGQRCDTEEADLSPDNTRLSARRYTDSAAPDAAGITLVELRESLEGVVIAPTQRVSGIDYSPRSELVVYSALGEGAREDLWVMLPNGADNRNLTASAEVHERRPRIDPSGSVAAFDRAAPGGKSEIWIFTTRVDQVRVTSGGPVGATLPGSDAVVGSDRDPAYAPDGQRLAFRRLAAPGDGRGDWEILTVRTDGSELTTLVSGPGFRGAPDWGAGGIVFAESDATGSRIVVVASDGAGRRNVLSLAPSLALAHPRWIP
jgi:hypothetical protein